MQIQRLLVLAGEELPGIEEVPPGVRTLLEAAAEVFVVAPTRPSRLHWLYSDVEDDRMHADERLASVLGALRSVGVKADGEVGADIPSLAIGDAIRKFEPDHVVCMIRHAEHGDWKLLERTEREFGVPMTLFEPTDTQISASTRG
ncbi:MAG: universal stress protein [Solirubrobacteraceae bacterium]|nr:universal stress protein [Solirubrobacteraceae bacterium]